MAFANFFDRTATAASQVLSNFNVDDYKKTLSDHVIGLSFDDMAVESAEGQATLDLCVRLLSRLYPAIAIFGSGSKASTHAAELEKLALAINDRIDLVKETSRPTITVVVGAADISGDGPKIFAGSDGWRALLSTKDPVGSGSSTNPFGAGAAACFAAANVFRHVFAKQLACGDLDRDIDLSLLHYQRTATPGAQLPTEIDLGDSHLAGLGAIGNGATWAFSRLPGLTGTLRVVDHDVVDLSNLQRYVMATQNDIGRPKTDLILASLKRSRLLVTANAVRWSDYVGGLKRRKFERVAVALDSASDRIGLQASLPKWIVNAWTQELDLGISRHGFGDGKACLACLYMPTGAVQSEDEKVAEELRLPEAKQQVREFLQTGQGVTEEFVGRVATAFDVPFAQLQPFVGQPLRSFHQGAICGGMMVSLTGNSNAGTAVVPMAFQSALAGIGMAADLVKHAAGLTMPASTSTRINLLRPLAPVLSDPRARDTTGRCICCDEDFLKAYDRKYEIKRQAAVKEEPDPNALNRV